jgi:hypothetical protein
VAAAGASVCFAIFAVIIKISGFSVATLASMQTKMLNVFFSGSSVMSSVASLLSPFYGVFAGLVFLTLGFSFLSSYGFFSTRSRMPYISPFIGSAAVLMLLGASIMGIFISVAMIVSSFYIIPLSNTYGKEFKRWVFFRTGSNSTGKVLMILNIIIFAAVLLSALSAAQAYQEEFKKGIADSLVMLAPDAQLPDEFRDVVNKEIIEEQAKKVIRETVDSSPVVASMARWLPILISISAWSYWNSSGHSYFQT